MSLKDWSEPLGRNLNTVRRNIFLIVFFLNLFGILIIYDASSIQAWHVYHDSMFYLKRQLFYTFVAYIFFVAALGIDLEKFKRYLPAIMGVGVLMLIAVLVPGIGKRIGGARRWIQLFGWNIQPSEIVKILYISYTAWCLSDDSGGSLLRRKRTLVGLFIVLCGLLILEPDLGTIIFLFMFTFLMFFLKGMPLKRLLPPLALGFIAVAILIMISPYRRARIVSFLNPWSDYEGKGYQIIQSQIAFGRGGLFGTGLGGSVQRLFYLPAAYTDFIYSIIGEEFGLLGAWGVIGLFFALLWYIRVLCLNIRDPFRHVLAVGIMSMFMLEIVLNMGVSVGIFPTKGLPLPFVSYGGSSLVVNFFSLGLLFNASK